MPHDPNSNQSRISKIETHVESIERELTDRHHARFTDDNNEENSYTLNIPQGQSLNLNQFEDVDDIQEIDAAFSRYSINSANHQFTGQWNSQFFQNISQTISYRYVERTSGESYGIVDANVVVRMKAFEFSLVANNIFNVAYSETNLVPMPKGNLLFGVKYDFE